MESNWLKYIETITTVLTFVFAVVITTIIGLRNTKNENRITVITKKRLVTHDNLRKAVQDIDTFSNPKYLASKESPDDTMFHLCETLSLLRVNLHAGYHMDFILIRKSEIILEEVSNITKSKQYDAEDTRRLDTLRHNFINLVDIYLTTEWRRIKKEIRKVSDYGDAWDRDFLAALLYNYYENTFTPGEKERAIMKSPLYAVVLEVLRKNKEAEKSKIIDIVESTYYFQHSKHESAEIVKAIEDLQQFGVVKHVDAKKWKVIAYDLDEFE